MTATSAVAARRIFGFCTDHTNKLLARFPILKLPSLICWINTLGHLNTVTTAIQVTAQMAIYLIYLFLFAPKPVAFFMNNLISAMTAMIAQISITRFPSEVFSISIAFPIFRIPVSQMTITPSPTESRMSIHRATISNPNNATSMNAVGLAREANAKKNHETTTYLSESL
jgi:hypothetical protein